VVGHPLEAEGLEHGEEDRHAAGQHGGAVGLDAGDRGDLGERAGGDQELLELAQAGQRDAGVAPAVLTQQDASTARIVPELPTQLSQPDSR
jgi:hypothetical protein